MSRKNKNEPEFAEERKTQDMSVVAEYNGEKSNRAKLVEFEGDDYDDTPVKDDSIKGKANNFWYHHKWHVIAAAILLVIGFIGIRQMVTREKNNTDISVLYAGQKELSAAEEEEFKVALAEMLGEDLNGDGEKKVYLYTSYYPGIAAAEEGGYPHGDVKFQSAVTTGECGVMFLDGALFDWLRESNALEKLEDALGYLPDKAFDEYGVRICDTEAYETYPVLQLLPRETVVCMRLLSQVDGIVISEGEAKEYYNAAVKLLDGYFNPPVKATNAEN